MASTSKEKRDWLGTHEDDVGHHNLTIEIIYHMQDENIDNVPKPTLSDVWEKISNVFELVASVQKESILST